MRVCICKRACTHAHTHTHAHTRTHARARAHTHVFVFTLAHSNCVFMTQQHFELFYISMYLCFVSDTGKHYHSQSKQGTKNSQGKKIGKFFLRKNKVWEKTNSFWEKTKIGKFFLRKKFFQKKTKCNTLCFNTKRKNLCFPYMELRVTFCKFCVFCTWSWVMFCNFCVFCTWSWVFSSRVTRHVTYLFVTQLHVQKTPNLQIITQLHVQKTQNLQNVTQLHVWKTQSTWSWVKYVTFVCLYMELSKIRVCFFVTHPDSRSKEWALT